jgi:hypothetical protein
MSNKKVQTGIEIPQFLSHLKTHGGYPVPFVQMWIDGKPDFRVVDPVKTTRCVHEQLCAICGFKLRELCYFIGGDLCKQNHLFTDPGMHEQCAEFSTRACAFLSGKKPKYSDRSVSENLARVEQMAASVRPKHIYIFETRTKKCKLVDVEGSPMIQAGPWSRIVEIQLC